MKPRATHTSRRAFSLVEVLIAILVLALGLLGLGAVFPVVIAQQRDAQDTVYGENVAATVEARIKNTQELVSFASTHLDPTDVNYWSWFNPDGDFGRDQTQASGGDFMYEWVIPQGGGDDTYQTWPDAPGPRYTNTTDLEAGIWYANQDFLPNLTDPAQLGQFLRVRDRLVPEPFSGRDPQFVWDLVARREPGADRPQVAIFVRRIDPRISVPGDSTLSEVLATGVNGNDPVLPLALNTNGQPAVDDGVGNFFYAYPQTLQAQTFIDHLDWLAIEDVGNGNDTSVAFATKPGQLLLDNTGTVRRVIGPVENAQLQGTLLTGTNVRVVRVDPPFQPAHAPVGGPGQGLSTNYAMNNNIPNTRSQRASWLRQIVFTPRTPVTIRVVTLEEPRQ